MSSATDGLPWPVVLVLALGTLAVLYGLSVLAARLHRPPPLAESTAALAAVRFGYEDEEDPE